MFPIVASKIHCWLFKNFEKARFARLQPNPDKVTSENLKTNINWPVTSTGTRHFNFQHSHGTPLTLYRGRLSTANFQKK